MNASKSPGSRFDPNLLVVLDKLLRTESVKETAKQLNITASAVSHTLSRLRDAVGDPILVRARRRMVPTHRAEMLREPLADFSPTLSAK